VIGFNRVRRLSEWKTNYKHNLQKCKTEDKKYEDITDQNH
jgi:hypothetical protein